MTGQTLRFYLTNCELPPLNLDCDELPPEGHKSHSNHLKVRPEEWRRLEGISALPPSISTIARNWTEANVMDDEPIEMKVLEKQKKQLRLPCPPVLTLGITLLPADTIEDISLWMYTLPLLTVESMVHLLYPEFAHWKFKINDDAQDYDRGIMRYFEWYESRSVPDVSQTHHAANHTQIPPSLIVFFQPPWILSDQDMEEFVHCRSFPRFRRLGYAFPSPLESHHRVWAKVWDLCARKNTRWFVLTSYNYWAFGGFSEGWSSGFITGIYPFSSTQPSIAEMLTFWVASSMQIPGSVSLPKVGDDPACPPSETPCTVYDTLGFCSEDEVTEPLDYQIGSISIPASAPTDVFEVPSDSESNWEGKSDTVESSAGVYSQLSDADSLDSMATVRARNHQRLHEPLIQQWIAKTGPTYTDNPPPITAPKVSPATGRRTAGAWLF